MSTLERDKQILDLIIRTYCFQSDLRERLDGKLNNFVAMTGTIATLSVGIALFVFDKISARNPYYIPLIVAFFAYLGVFVIAMTVGLLGYKPTEYSWYPDDSERLIADYSKLSEVEVIRKIAGSYALASNCNKSANAKKATICNRVFWLFLLGVILIVVFAVLMILAIGVSPVVDP